MSRDSISYRQEVRRKLIHLSSLWMPVTLYLLPETWGLWLFSALLVLMLAYEVLRRQQGVLGQYARRMFSAVLRDHELATGSFQLTGATYMILSVWLCLWLFPVSFVIVALGILLLADTAASLVGRRWGRTPLMGKSVEGLLAFVIAGLLMLAMLQMCGIYTGFAEPAICAVLVAGVVELTAKRLHLDDNLAVTVAACVALWLTQPLFLI